ncbi:MAG: YheU family protein [Gammaproteobacteria bacterium]|nr:YheU family protein [Gammaproteobacteria bacterium]
MRIPHTALSAESLRAVVEEFVTREGTEYGSRDYSLDEKVHHVMRQLECEEVIIEYDPDSQTCTLLSKDSQ